MRIRALLVALGLIGVAALGANAQQTEAAWVDNLQALARGADLSELFRFDISDVPPMFG